MSDTRAALEASIAGAAGAPATPAAGAWRRFEPVMLGAGSILALLVVWELVPHVFTVSAGTRLFFTTPSQIAATLWPVLMAEDREGVLGLSAHTSQRSGMSA